MTPEHYDMTIQPVEFIIANDIPFIEGNIIKYICRYKEKGGISDLEKARHYLDLLIEQYEEIENAKKGCNIFDEPADLEKKNQEKIASNTEWEKYVVMYANEMNKEINTEKD